MGIKPGDSSVVIGYQVDEFPHTWSAKQFVACCHIYPGFTGKVSSLTHLPLEPGCEEYAFWIRLFLTLNKAWIPSSLIHSRHQNWTLPWMSLMSLHFQSSAFLCWVSTLSDNSKPQLASSVCTHKLWCQARDLLAPVSLATKMSASKLIHYISSHPAAFGFQASTPPDNITLNSANRKADQFLSDFQTGVDTTACATHDTEQLGSCLRVALLILFPHYSMLREVLYQFLKCMNYFMTFWTRLFPNELETQLTF